MPSTDVASYVPTDPPTPNPSGALAAWVRDFEGVANAAVTLAATSFIPDSIRVYRDPERRTGYDGGATAAHVTAAILTGHELGLDPMASLRSIDIIKGTPALRAVALRAILQSAGHEIWVEEGTNNRATVCGRRRGTDHVQRITWTIEDARSRGLAGRPVWRAAPRNMLIARATADIARLVAADALLGIPYTVEELEDGDISTDDQDSAPPAPRRARRAPIQAPTITRDDPRPVTDEPDPEPPPRPPERPPADDDPDTDDGPNARATTQQVSAVRRALVAAGHGTSRKQLDAVAAITGRPIERLGDLWQAEAVAILAVAAEQDRDPDQDEPSGWDGRRGPEPDAPEWGS